MAEVPFTEPNMDRGFAYLLMLTTSGAIAAQHL